MSANFSLARRNRPLVVVLGATGSGKTKLAIELCKQFCGQLVSADSMQLYNCLRIATNQSSASERGGVPEHLVGFLPALTFGYTVHAFRQEALRAIDQIHLENGLPVLVGGTNYYVEAVLWKNLIDHQCASKLSDYYASLPEDVLSWSNEMLHSQLARVDPARAAQLHPNDRRRILRSLQVWHSGARHSDLLQSQHDQRGASIIGGQLRFANSIVLYLQWEKECLFKRLEERVRQMIANGLCQEITSFYDAHHADYVEKVKALPAGSDQQPKGAFQCIGFKEFDDFLKLPPDQRESDTGRATFAKCAENLHLSCCQYAKRQMKWIKNRFLNRPGGQVPPVKVFQLCRQTCWEDDVKVAAFDLVQCFLDGRQVHVDQQVRESGRKRHQAFNHCELCNRMIEVGHWDAHLASRKHRAARSRCKRQVPSATLLVENSN